MDSDDKLGKADEYRRKAFACIGAAERVSLQEERARLLRSAEHWLDLAIAETEKNSNGGRQPR